MIKLLLAVKKRGVEIDKIYNNDVLDEGEEEEEDMKKCVPENVKGKDKVEGQICYQDSLGSMYADNSCKLNKILLL